MALPTGNLREQAAVLGKERHLASYLHEAALRFPDKVAVIFGDRKLSYAEFESEARRLARKLVTAGVRPGDRVALHMHNGSDLAISYFGCFHAGAIAAPINTLLKSHEIEFILTHSDASLYLGHPDLFQEVESLRPRLPQIRKFVTDWRELTDSPSARLPSVHPDEPAAILYTSGPAKRSAGPFGICINTRLAKISL
jgi:long-chain acyl-CoA synthetase